MYKRQSQYIQNYPLPDIHSPEAKAIIKTVKQLNRNNLYEEKKLEKLIDNLENQVAKAFGVPPVVNLD